MKWTNKSNGNVRNRCGPGNAYFINSIRQVSQPVDFRSLLLTN